MRVTDAKAATRLKSLSLLPLKIVFLCVLVCEFSLELVNGSFINAYIFACIKNHDEE